MAKFKYATTGGAMKEFEAADQASALAASSGFADRAPSSGIQTVNAPAPTTPAPSTTTDVATSTTTKAPRTVKYTQDEDEGFKAKTYEEIQRDLTRGAQGQINAINDYAKSLLAEQAVVNEKNDRSTQSISTLTGLAGSTEANVQQQATTAIGQKANKAITDEANLKVQTILGNIKQSALDEARLQREEERLDEADRIKARAARQEEAVTQLQNIASAGVTFEGLKASDNEAFTQLAKTFGGEDALKGAFVLNTPQEQILDKRVEGGKYVIAKQNPVTGKVTVETLDLGLPPQYTKTVDAGNRILAIPDNWDGDPSNLITINKGLTPAQARTTGGGGVGGGSGAYESDLDAIIGATLSTIPTKFGQATFQAQMAKARNDSDRINLIAAQVLKNQPAEFKNDFRNQAVGISQIDKAIALIDSGVKTGVLNNSAQYAYNLAGRDFDPKIAKINSYITSAIQPYRNSVTGAAWGTQEDQEYASLFGSTKYSPAELRQRLVQTKEILKSKSANGLNTFVNPIGYYDNPFESGSLSSGNRVLVSPKGEQFDASGLTEDEYQEAINDGYRPQ